MVRKGKNIFQSKHLIPIALTSLAFWGFLAFFFLSQQEISFPRAQNYTQICVAGAETCEYFATNTTYNKKLYKTQICTTDSITGKTFWTFSGGAYCGQTCNGPYVTILQQSPLLCSYDPPVASCPTSYVFKNGACVQECLKSAIAIQYCAYPQKCILQNGTYSCSPGSTIASISPYPLTLSATSRNYAASTDGTKALDGNLTTSWNAGSAAPQWIRVDLGKVGTVSQISLIPNQSPATAMTTQKIYTSSSVSSNSLGTLVATLTQSTTSGKTLEKTFSPPLTNVRYVTIQTTSSPSWVSWFEIQVWP